MSQHQPVGQPGPQPGRLVRRPRYLPFLVTGALLGALATAVVVLGFGDQVDQTRKLTLYLGVLLCGIGALIGGGLAVWLERER